MQHERWITGNVHYIILCKVNKEEPTLALKPTGDITRGTSVPKNKTCEYVQQKHFQK